MRGVLFATSEIHPLVKTGGLGDVCGALPPVLRMQGLDVRVVLPGYRQVLHRCSHFRPSAQLALPGSLEPVRILEGVVDDGGVPLYVIDAPGMYDRGGGPYGTTDGHDWPDNANRFALFCRAIVAMATGAGGIGWQPEVVHCNDWQTGLVPALLARMARAPGTVFTIHNLAYSGCFDRPRFDTLALPDDLFAPAALEFYGLFCFIKGGLAYADALTTVSPTYAREIQTAAYGHGFDGLIRHRAGSLTGILNGVDYRLWDPRHDPHLDAHYGADSVAVKTDHKLALQRHFGLDEDANALLLGAVTRLAEQKGVDLILGALPAALADNVQMIMLGSGDGDLHHAINALARAQPRRCGVYIGYNEALAHRIIAGADALLMPSRYEPCGLAQMYSLRYGTVPIVRRTGGLADSVIPATPATLADGTATGVAFDDPTAAALLAAIRAAHDLYREPAAWRRLQATGMGMRFDWATSAAAYAQVYARVARGAGP